MQIGSLRTWLCLGEYKPVMVITDRKKQPNWTSSWYCMFLVSVFLKHLVATLFSSCLWFFASRTVGDPESEREMAFLLPWLVSSLALPFLFFICGKRSEKCHSEGVCCCCCCKRSLFNDNQCCTEINLDLAGASSSSSRLRGVQNVFRWTCLCKLWVTSLKIWSEYSSPTVSSSWVVCRLQGILWQGDTETWDQTSVYDQKQHGCS